MDRGAARSWLACGFKRINGHQNDYLIYTPMLTEVTARSVSRTTSDGKGCYSRAVCRLAQVGWALEYARGTLLASHQEKQSSRIISVVLLCKQANRH